MPLQPPSGEPEPPHPRLARYHERVAQILDHDRAVGLLLVHAHAFSTQLGGRLWWRRWSAWQWGASLWLTLPSLGVEFDDGMVAPDDLDGELDEWDAGRFHHAGHTYTLRWLDEQTSRRLADSEFGIETA